MRSLRLILPGVFCLTVAGPAEAFDMHDVRLLQDSGYRSCQGCNLREVKLQGANLSGVQLQNADLSGAQLQNARLWGAQLQNADLSGAQLQNADLWGAKLQNADLSDAQLQNTTLGVVVLQDTRLRRAQLQGADLSGVQLQNADLSGAQLQNAKLEGAQLQNADLSAAQLQNARLWGAQLQNADLTGAQFQNADLRDAQLRGADLVGSTIEGAKLAFSDLTNVTYAPASPPPDRYVEGIKGLSTLRVPYDEGTQQALVSGLVLLRELLQTAGLRDLEREATFSIERAQTHHALNRWREHPLRAAEGVARLIFFEWPVAYGLRPWRALQLLLGLILLLSFAYWPAIGRTARSQGRRGAIYQIWPNERLIDDRDGIRLATYGDMPERLRAHRLKAKSLVGQYGYALYFSLLSAFHLGWRELNVGTWLARLQRHEYTLRALGGPRVLSGLQSLISVYLVAIWALTYFGRPFQ